MLGFVVPLCPRYNAVAVSALLLLKLLVLPLRLQFLLVVANFFLQLFCVLSNRLSSAMIAPWARFLLHSASAIRATAAAGATGLPPTLACFPRHYVMLSFVSCLLYVTRMGSPVSGKLRRRLFPGCSFFSFIQPVHTLRARVLPASTYATLSTVVPPPACATFSAARRLARHLRFQSRFSARLAPPSTHPMVLRSPSSLVKDASTTDASSISASATTVASDLALWRHHPWV
eukprot:gb/GEZN01002712.1/.p1 GENE.gb/GEZN01002712.1/~~gb/GEZN01002712.1/.p1  ORF type:complete len:231 (+),score=20.62 gb/GEZN01002712.1/:1572-2264(+)